MEDKKYSPWPDFKPHSVEPTLEDHTQHHAPVKSDPKPPPVGPPHHHAPVGHPHRPLPDHPNKRVGENLHRLRQLRTQVDSLFCGLESDASADAAKLHNLATTYDTIGTVLTLGAQAGLIVQHSLREGAEEIIKDKVAREAAGRIIKHELSTEVARTSMEEVAKEAANHAADNLSPQKGWQHDLGTVLHVFANSGPSYLAAIRLQTKGKSLREIAKSADRIANSRPEDLLAESRRELWIQHRQTLQRIDQEIQKNEVLLRKS